MTTHLAQVRGARRGIWSFMPCLLLLSVGMGELRAQVLMSGDQLHASAVKHFRAGRFPEAYGRFVGLASAGHAPSARIALWMCAEGPSLFGSDWDCTPDEVSAWTSLSRSGKPLQGNPIPVQSARAKNNSGSTR